MITIEALKRLIIVLPLKFNKIILALNKTLRQEVIQMMLAFITIKIRKLDYKIRKKKFNKLIIIIL
jgi:hypothetical protein